MSAHHIVHAHHHGPHHHHHHHLHHFGESKLVDLSPNATKFNFVFNGKSSSGAKPTTQEKFDDDESVKMSPKIRFGSKGNNETPTHRKYGKSPIHASSSVYQISVTGSRRPVSQVTHAYLKAVMLVSWLVQRLMTESIWVRFLHDDLLLFFFVAQSE